MIQNRFQFGQLVWVLVWQFVFPCARAGESITQDGKASAVVICSAKVSPSEEHAAAELVHYIEQVSGAKLPLHRADAPEGLPKVQEGLRIFVGNETCRVFHPDISLEGLGQEGFVIKTKGKDLVIAGGTKRGTLYGAYTFIEDYCGVRWWSPLDTDVPKKATLELGEVDRREVPQLELRDAMYRQGSDSPAWDVRNKINGMSFNPLNGPRQQHWGGSAYEYFGGSFAHNQHKLVQDSGIPFEPEMYALTTGGQRAKLQPCSTHPKVVEGTIKSLLELDRKYPQSPYFVMAHEDNDDYCTCARCKAIDDEEGTHMGQLMYLVNKAAEALEKQNPRAKIMVSAYTWSWLPPKKMRPRDNVMIRLAPITQNYFYPLANSAIPANQEIEKNFKDWGAISKHNYVFSYSCNFTHYYIPWPNFDSMLANVDFFVANGVKSICYQGTHTSAGTEFWALRMWTLSKKLWNPGLDNGQLMKTFIEGYYGPAAPMVARYIEVLQAPVRGSVWEVGKSGCYQPVNAPYLRPETVAELDAICREAEKAVGDREPYARRVRHMHMPVRYVLLSRGVDSPTWAAVERKSGKLDLSAMASSFLKVMDEFKMGGPSDDDRDPAGWRKWLGTYPALVKEKKTHLMAPEAREAKDLVRYWQSWQIRDGFIRTKNRVEDPRASDGWAIKVDTLVFKFRHVISDYEGIEPGKKYRLHLRVRGGDPAVGFQYGMGGTTGPLGKVPLEEVTGTYKVHSSPPFEAKADMNFFIAGLFSPETPGVKPGVNHVLLDCIWLTKEP